MTNLFSAIWKFFSFTLINYLNFFLLQNKTVPNIIPHATVRPHKNNIGNSDISFHVELFKTPYYTEANYKYPMNVSLKSNIYVDAFIQGGK
jgi:hypothetical protein